MVSKDICGYFKEEPIYKYTVSNKNGMKFSCISHGATLTEIIVPDKNKKPINVLLDFDKLDDYLNDNQMYAGASIGRVAGRISNSEFEINGKKYSLKANNGKNLLHGGVCGFNSYNWEGEISKEDNSITFSKTITKEEDGFPGKIEVKIAYSLNDNNDLIIDFSGVSDEDTLFNPTNHSYFNLDGCLDNLLENHELKINADYIAETRSDNMPTGEFKEVKGTGFDFREFKNLMSAIKDVKDEFKVEGIDHPFKLNSKEVATLISSNTGIKLSIESDRNSLVVYTLNFPPGDSFKVGNKKIPQYGAVALEPQTLPDAINQNDFGDIVLLKDDKKQYKIKYHFDVES